MLRACVAMGLKQNQEAIELAAARSFQRGANLHRVMAVVVDHGDAVYDALDVEAAADACELRQALANQLGRNVQVKRYRSCCRSIADVVNARWMRQLEHPEILAPVGEAKLAAESFHPYLADHQVGLA